MSGRRPSRLTGPWIGVALILAALGILEAAGRSGALDTAVTPLPSQVAARVASIVGSGELFAPLGKTLYLLFSSYAIAGALGILVGVLTGRSQTLYRLLEPLLELLRPLPKPALLPPFMLFLGIGDLMKISIVVLSVFFPVLINTVQGVRGVDPILVNTARTFGHGSFAVTTKVIIPAAAPMIFAGLRVSLGLALVMVVLAEMLAGTGGLGFLVIDMQRAFRVLDMYAWVVVLAVLGYLLNALFLAVERHAVGWARSEPGN